ncbi:MAG TPA: glycosyltransferase [Dissulfurispiraceae bacterium]|nr:glycosyltransferase [Dissulfurispiraceae bacterium]
MSETAISVVIPTYKRERVLLDTIEYLLKLELCPSEIMVIDQTGSHEFVTSRALTNLDAQGKISWIRLPYPSITHAMNIGLLEARHDIVLFLDDDVIPDKNLIKAHLSAHAEGHNIVAGQVLQPGEDPLSIDHSGSFRFCSSRGRFVNEFIGCNFSVKRKLGLTLGGFDENFVHVAYRYEGEFADRALAAGEKIFFEPAASIRHLKAQSGGTRSFGEHLKTIKPSHSVGEYYYLMRSKIVQHRLIKILSRPLRAVRTKHHLRRPWWIPVTLVSEMLGFVWAVSLFLQGPKYVTVKSKK